MGPTACLDGCGKFTVTGIRFPACAARSEQLYRLSYRTPLDSKFLYQIPKIRVQTDQCTAENYEPSR